MQFVYFCLSCLFFFFNVKSSDGVGPRTLKTKASARALWLATNGPPANGIRVLCLFRKWSSVPQPRVPTTPLRYRRVSVSASYRAVRRCFHRTLPRAVSRRLRRVTVGSRLPLSAGSCRLSRLLTFFCYRSQSQAFWERIVGRDLMFELFVGWCSDRGRCCSHRCGGCVRGLLDFW